MRTPASKLKTKRHQMPAMTTPEALQRRPSRALFEPLFFQGGRYGSDPGFVCPKLDRCEKPFGGPEKARTRRDLASSRRNLLTICGNATKPVETAVLEFRHGEEEGCVPNSYASRSGAPVQVK
jgi:hypothetical protein